MKKYLAAQEVPPRHRVTTLPEVIRAPRAILSASASPPALLLRDAALNQLQDYFKKEVIPLAAISELEIPCRPLCGTRLFGRRREVYIRRKEVGVPG